MNCKKVKRLLSLMVGSEIPPSKTSAIKAHLEKCPKCQHEYDFYILSLEKTKEWLARDRKDWEDREWQEAVQKAIREGKHEVTPFVLWPFKKAWAYALVGVLAAALTFLFVIRPSYIEKEKGPVSEMMAEYKRQLFKSFEDKSQQEVISMTMVSKETGLKIVWFFNRNFKLEGEK